MSMNLNIDIDKNLSHSITEEIPSRLGSNLYYHTLLEQINVILKGTNAVKNGFIPIMKCYFK